MSVSKRDREVKRVLYIVGTYLVEGGHESSVVTEGRHHQRVVLPVDIQDRLYVHLGVLKKTQPIYSVQNLCHTHRE